MNAATLATQTPPTVRPRFSRRDWLLCSVVGLGFVFDGFEILVMPVTVRPALLSLGVPRASFNLWVGLLLYVPAITAGLFGLMGGYLLDRFGRRRILVWSLLLYCFATAGAATASSPLALLLWRCATLSGVALEFVAALTYLAELFPVAPLRERVLGFSQALYAVGNFVVTGTYYAAVTFAAQLPAIGGRHDAWRYALAVGVLPSIPLILMRSRLPESPMWLASRAAVRRRLNVSALLSPSLRRSTLTAVAITAFVYAGTYGVLQQGPRLVPGLPDVRVLSPRAQEQMVSAVHLFSSLGDLAGRCLFAVVVVSATRQRRLLRTFLVPALVVIPFSFLYASSASVTAFKIATFAGTLLLTAQFSFLGNYLPRLFPTSLRGSGESVAINFGGRVLGTSAAFITPQLATLLDGPDPTMQLARAMAVVGFVVLLAGLTATHWMSEPAKQLPVDEN
jgi:MFS family permease